jgi:hypothetical protein
MILASRPVINVGWPVTHVLLHACKNKTLRPWPAVLHWILIVLPSVISLQHSWHGKAPMRLSFVSCAHVFAVIAKQSVPNMMWDIARLAHAPVPHVHKHVNAWLTLIPALNSCVAFTKLISALLTQ